jgi:hypothetical protein
LLKNETGQWEERLKVLKKVNLTFNIGEKEREREGKCGRKQK